MTRAALPTAPQRAAVLANLRAGFAFAAACKAAGTTGAAMRRALADDAALVEAVNEAELAAVMAPRGSARPVTATIAELIAASSGGAAVSAARGEVGRDVALAEQAAPPSRPPTIPTLGGSGVAPVHAPEPPPPRDHQALLDMIALEDERGEIVPGGAVGGSAIARKGPPVPSHVTDWAAVAKASAEREEEEAQARAERTPTRWTRALDAIAGRGHFGALTWVESMCVAAGMHPLDPMWWWHFQEFYASGKPIDVGRFGLRAAKSASVCRALVAEVLLGQRRLEAGVIGVCPVMSANMREAGDRFETITKILAACGLTDRTGTRAEEEGSFKRSGGGNAAHVVSLQDAYGNDVEFRIYPASIAGAAGFTGIAGFCDEADLWGKEGAANPFGRVIEVLMTRYTTQPGAKLHIVSAPYYSGSAFEAMVARGDTMVQRVARLGHAGAAKDNAERSRLAIVLASKDALLTAAADPQSCDIPSWVANPTAPIEACYQGAQGDLRRMFALYGGRADCATPAGTTVDELQALAEMNRRLVAPVAASPYHGHHGDGRAWSGSPLISGGRGRGGGGGRML